MRSRSRVIRSWLQLPFLPSYESHSRLELCLILVLRSFARKDSFLGWSATSAASLPRRLGFLTLLAQLSKMLLSSALLRHILPSSTSPFCKQLDGNVHGLHTAIQRPGLSPMRPSSPAGTAYARLLLSAEAARGSETGAHYLGHGAL